MKTSDSYILLRNVRLADPQTGRIDGCDILALCRGSLSEILKIGRNLRAPAQENLSILNAHGRPACAPFTDLRCQIPDPGFEYRESLQSGLVAACAGGFGRALLMPVSKPLPDTKSLVAAQIKSARAAGACRALIAVPMSKGGKGQTLPAFSELKNAGAVAVCGDFEEKEPSASLLISAARACAEEGLFFIAPCKKKSVHERPKTSGGKTGSYLSAARTDLGAVRIDPLGEILALSDALLVSEHTGCPVHFPLVTLKESVSLIRNAKKRGVRISCATAPQYFALNESEVVMIGSYAKFDPPLRDEEDRLAVVEGLKDGTIDCICSDHTPLSPAEKKDGTQALPGAVGLETAFAAGLTYLVLSGHLTLPDLVRLLSFAPAKLLGIDASVRVGGPLDLLLLDPDREMISSSNALRSRSSNTPFFISELRGVVTTAFLDGARYDF